MLDGKMHGGASLSSVLKRVSNLEREARGPVLTDQPDSALLYGPAHPHQDAQALAAFRAQHAANLARLLGEDA